MSETLTETPPGTPESPPPGYEHFPNPEGSEEGAGGSEETGFFAGGESPGLEPEVPGQQAEALPGEPEKVAAPEQQVTEPTQQLEKPAKEDESRFEYQQSRADKAENALKDVTGRSTYKIAQYIESRPELLDIVESASRGEPLGKPQGLPEKPVIPKRPKDFDRSEANDPETVSGRYRMDFEEYQEKRAIYDEARETRQETEGARKAQEAYFANLKNGLIGTGQLDGRQADEFLQMLNSPESLNPEALAKFYHILKTPSQVQVENQEKADRLRAKKPGLESPPPLAKAGSEAPLPTTDEDDYHAAMRAEAEMGGSLL